MNKIEGIGLGLRIDFANELFEKKPKSVRWLEVHPENYMFRGGRFASELKRARDHWPVCTHGLTMCLGSAVPHEKEYLDPLKSFLKEVGTPWHSDHLCFAGAGGTFVHDLLPIPFNQDSADTVTARVKEAQGALDVEVAIENVSYYVENDDSEGDEIDFLNEVFSRTDAKFMLDVNNVFVNSQNLGFDPKAWIDRVPGDRVIQMHVAGHLVGKDGFRIDTHSEPVPDGVYELFEYTLEKIGPKPVLLERDGNFPPVDALVQEIDRLDAIYQRATARYAASQPLAVAP